LKETDWRGEDRKRRGQGKDRVEGREARVTKEGKKGRGNFAPRSFLKVGAYSFIHLLIRRSSST